MNKSPKNDPTALAQRETAAPTSLLTHWLQSVRKLLERAEKHISNNFRVPPNGG